MATQLNNWLTIDKASGMGNAQITLTASSYSELVDRAASLRIQAQSTNTILNVRQRAYSPIKKNNNYFWAEFEEIGGEVTMVSSSNSKFYYSFDGETWGGLTSRVGLGTYKIIYIKDVFPTNTVSFNFNKNAKVGGRLSSLWDVNDDTYGRLFENNIYLTDASELILPDKLSRSCFYAMFKGCTNLVKGPELPYTALYDDCYGYMFDGCTSLTTAPALPATTLAERCYYAMFEGCTSLIAAPKLPANTLKYACYCAMFAGCTSLVNAPKLPATTLSTACYQQMFKNCTSLNYIKMLATDISATNCLYEWVYKVAPTGTFVKASSNTSITVNSVNGIPKGWTVETATE